MIARSVLAVVVLAARRDLDVTYDDPSRGLEGNYARRRGNTALMTAARAGQLEVVKLLAEGGASLYAESRLRDGSEPRNVFDYAVDSRRLPIVAYLWSKSDGVRFAARLDRHIAERCDARQGHRRGGVLFAAPARAARFSRPARGAVSRNTLHCVAYHPSMRNLRPIQERIAVASFLLDRGADPNDLAIAAAANSCVYGGDAAQLEPRQQPQLEVIEHRLQASADARPYATAPGRSRVRILTNCCSRSPLTATQRRICGVFGL